MHPIRVTGATVTSPSTVDISIELDGAIRLHTITVGEPIRVLQAPADMNDYPEVIRIQAYRAAADALQRARADAQAPHAAK